MSFGTMPDARIKLSGQKTEKGIQSCFFMPMTKTMRRTLSRVQYRRCERNTVVIIAVLPYCTGTNAQSRAIEAAMRVYRIPAKVIGNLGFYDRKEIKDVLSYLCLLVNDHDNLRLKRIINEPRRGIGDVTVAAVEKLSNELNIGMLEVCRRADEFSELSRARDKLRAFAAVIDELRGFAAENPMHMLIERVLDKTG